MARRRQSKQELTPYQKKLLDPRWQKKRLEIFQRDGWRCQSCGDTQSTLHVHHRWYERDCQPWEHDPEALVTLCATCHQDETEDRPYFENYLLETLRKIGFLAREVSFIAYAFRRFNPSLFGGDMTLMLAWAIETESAMQQVGEQYIKHHPR